MSHDPVEHIRGLQQLLISDKKRIAFLFGAGTSLAKKNSESRCVPAIGELTEDITNNLCSVPKYDQAVNEIKSEMGKGMFNIETFLSNMQQKYEIIGGGTLNGLNHKEFEELIQCVKSEIRERVSVHKEILKEDEKLNNLIHVNFAEWIGRADRKYPIEIFTTNYDYLLELGLEEKRIPYYDGFTGSYEPFFDSNSVNNLDFLPKQTKLWKLHGSLGWQLDIASQKVLRKDSDHTDILIYPSTLKYSHSKKQPYIALMDRLSNFLKEPDTILITCGYSFGDDHINERILSALDSRNSGHVIGLFYDKLPKEDSYSLTEDSSVCKMAQSNGKISIYGCGSAVIGCQFGKWNLKVQPDKDDPINVVQFFDMRAPFDPNAPLNTELKGGGWTGEGDLILPDFSKFVFFLKSMVSANPLAGESKI
jgi:hypothetical protein